METILVFITGQCKLHKHGLQTLMSMKRSKHWNMYNTLLFFDRVIWFLKVLGVKHIHTGSRCNVSPEWHAPPFSTCRAWCSTSVNENRRIHTRPKPQTITQALFPLIILYFCEAFIIKSVSLVVNIFPVIVSECLYLMFFINSSLEIKERLFLHLHLNWLFIVEILYI